MPLSGTSFSFWRCCLLPLQRLSNSCLPALTKPGLRLPLRWDTDCPTLEWLPLVNLSSPAVKSSSGQSSIDKLQCMAWPEISEIPLIYARDFASGTWGPQKFFVTNQIFLYVCHLQERREKSRTWEFRRRLWEKFMFSFSHKTKAQCSHKLPLSSLT